MSPPAGGRALAACLVTARLAEMRLAKRNERAARAAGAVEHGARHYPATRPAGSGGTAGPVGRAGSEVV